MQHRQLRLGDILDDYCPRERRITNHALVAMIGQEVKRTRCTTCDAEHEYKHAKVPPMRRKKETASALVKEALAGAPQEPAAAGLPADEPDSPASAKRRAAATPPPAAPPQAAAPVEEPEVPEAAELDVEPQGGPDEQETEEADGPVQRRLIRATLPRPEGPATRPTPQFTMRQQGGRGAGFAGGGKTRTPPRHRGAHAGAGRPQGSGAMTARTGFGRGTNRDPFGSRPGGRAPEHARTTRHAHPGRPRDGKKHSK